MPYRHVVIISSPLALVCCGDSSPAAPSGPAAVNSKTRRRIAVLLLAAMGITSVTIRITAAAPALPVSIHDDPGITTDRLFVANGKTLLVFDASNGKLVAQRRQ